MVWLIIPQVCFRFPDTNISIAFLALAVMRKLFLSAVPSNDSCPHSLDTGLPGVVR